MLTVQMFLIVCPLLFLAGFVDSIAGGGGLISLPAYTFAGLPIHAAIATNKLSSTMGTSVSTLHYLRKGFMDWLLCLPSVALAIVGSMIGARLNLIIDETILKRMLLVVLPIVAIVMFRRDVLSAGESRSLPGGRTLLLCCIAAFTVGMYDGFYGPGTGTFLMLLLTGVARLDVNRSAGVTKAINLTSNITALSVYLLSGNVLLPLGLAAGAFNMLGNALGSRCFSARGAKIARPVILIVLVVFFAKLLLEMLAGAA